MNAISQPTHSQKSPKFTTLTALAAACAMMLSAPVNAAEVDASATATTSVPSAIDSSKRVIRLARPNAAVSATQAAITAQPEVAKSTAAQVSAQANINTNQQSSAQVTNTQINNTQPTPTRAPQNTIQNQAIQTNQNTELTGTTRVYERGPMVATGIDLRGGQLSNIPTPQVQLSDISFVPTILIAQQTGLGTDKLDVSLLDDFIKDTSPYARHYPPNFPNRTQRHYAREKIKVLTDWIEPYAKSPKASYDVLLRAAKLNGMGRNLDLGSEYTVRGGQYIDRAIKIKPDSGEANFIYGMMLSEGGGFKEGQKYLDQAVNLGYTEAEQSLAQSDVLSDRREKALERLRRLEQKVPDNTVIRQQIKLIEDGKFYIWDIPASNIKPNM
ncbi:tetratricopeptide repeat protein [Psychrobacter cryohalolentis]|uniref:tetratricopeptide repeat protein n=1 Tax=Psychrobacter cryohalolentis TaxID=330922 RepID=UPI003F8464FF